MEEKKKRIAELEKNIAKKDAEIALLSRVLKDVKIVKNKKVAKKGRAQVSNVFDV